ncbi:TIGR01440 family protein [Metabacillus arenae]|uniref:UPF0340 protein IC621_25110 n=1 Tax=Metabacillus arenae TaxID=2771434 RepID=A0A926S3Z6_9BACI|nr:TIGR01440 family protein [Metabacillus arenae]MBD1383464.1 TIGR01440 family protein [Metabacillus arenae]
MTDLQNWQEDLQTILDEFKNQTDFSKGDLIVIGCSTSEVIGQKIGTAGTFEAAEMIFNQLEQFKIDTGVELAFQCCEHLNRALVLEKETAKQRQYEEVNVIPVHKAGGAMAAHAYRQLENPVVVEFIKAEGGIDIGDTFIGMHLKHVAVPVRASKSAVGHAHVTLAQTRPKLIGGVRAVYEEVPSNLSCK